MKTSGEIVTAVLRRYPDTPTMTLARKISKENPAVFNTLDTARAAVRYYRGKCGRRNRRRLTDKTYVRESFSQDVFEKLPEPLTEYKDFKPYELSPGKWLVLADLHVPYYRKEELILTLQWARKQKVDGIILLGDIADFYSVSWWVRDPRRRNFSRDRDALLAVLGVIRSIFPKQPIIYKVGNHEERLERYLRVKAPELIGTELFNFERIIEAQRFGIKTIADRRALKLDRLYLIHGHEFGQGSYNPVNPARTLYLRGKEIALCAHYHQTSQETDRSLADIFTSCWSVGCLCDLHPEYRPFNNWNYGFAVIDATGDFVVDNKKIINGQIY